MQEDLGPPAIEGIRPIPQLTGLIAPVVGQYFRGPWASSMLQNLPENSQIFIVPDPHNNFDKNAQKVVIYQDKKFLHVGFVQRHTAAEISRLLCEHSCSAYKMVGKLKKLKGSDKDVSIEIVGVVKSIKNLVKQQIEVANDTGIFGGVKNAVKPTMCVEEQLKYCADAHLERRRWLD